MTDTEKLLQLLRAAGGRGVHTSELRYHGVSGNPSQRRADLEARGHTITSTPEPYPSNPRRHGARYRLAEPSTTSPAAVPTAGDMPAPSSLPVARASSSRCAIFDDWDEAA